MEKSNSPALVISEDIVKEIERVNYLLISILTVSCSIYYIRLVKIYWLVLLLLLMKLIIDFVQRLSEKRVSGGRQDSLEDMSLDQLIDEKAAMQKALLQLEATFGRPSSKKDRDVVRPLYERYRQLKRSLLKQTPVSRPFYSIHK